MSCSLWRWTPSCDRELCVGDCDLCDIENWGEYDEMFEEATEMELRREEDADSNTDFDNL